MLHSNREMRVITQRVTAHKIHTAVRKRIVCNNAVLRHKQPKLMENKLLAKISNALLHTYMLASVVEVMTWVLHVILLMKRSALPSLPFQAHNQIESMWEELKSLRQRLDVSPAPPTQQSAGDFTVS